MKAKRGDIERAVAAPSAYRLFLLHGPDAAGSGALLKRLGVSLGPDVERLALSGAMLKGDPAKLADEAASFSLFGGKRLIVVEGGDELHDAVDGMLQQPAGGNPVVVIAPALKKTSKLLIRVEAALDAIAFASYVPEGRDADQLVIELGRAAGLDIAPDLARRLATASGGDRAILRFEIDKFSLFLDVAPDRPARLEADVVDALSAGSEEGDLAHIVDAVLDGDPARLDRELAQLGGGGTEAVGLLRALIRRLLVLARYRVDVERGNSVDSVLASAGKSLFFKDKAAVGRQLGRWSAERLAAALGHALDAERALKAPASVGPTAVDATLFKIAQVASRRR
ncbi:MAG TPA: DNA polymerase III subunit delta [Sphingomonadaceae bacterium]|nr:DNA polymerase III subunit delta [Sphingomonadaceae bacterium]